MYCGMKSIRVGGDDVVTEEDVKRVYVDFKTKISDMIQLNKLARMYVSCLLPIKCQPVNSKV